MEVYIFDRDLNLQGILGNYVSLIWRRRYSKHGNFELYCVLTSENLRLLKKGNVIWKNDDLEAGYIEHKKLAQDSNGKELLIIQGKFLTGYLGRRIVWETENINTTSEIAIRGLINNNAINPTNPDRKIDLLVLGELKDYIQTINKQTSYKNLLEEIEGIANISELGIRTLADIQDKQMIFEVYEGIDRTSSNGVISPAIFSQKFENIFEQEYTDSLSNYRNTALVAGEGEGGEREKVAIEEGQGLDRYELYVDARDLQKENRTTEQYVELLKNRGNTKLTEHKKIETFECKVNANSNLIYKEDFDIGDIVTCTSKKWGITIDTRITEIEEIYEASGKQVNVTFGNKIPTLTDKIKQVVM